jgi:hypothetical protein
MPKFRKKNIFTTVATSKDYGDVICIIDGPDEWEESTRVLLTDSTSMDIMNRWHLFNKFGAH